MAGIIKGTLSDFKALVPCKIYSTASVAAGDHFFVEGVALIDTGASDVIIRQRHQGILALIPDGPALENACMGLVSLTVPYRTIVVLSGVDVNDPTREYHKGFGQAQPFINTFTEEADFVLGMNVLSMLDMRFGHDGRYELTLP